MFEKITIFEPLVRQQESFDIKLPQFEGPFDLLLFFIERDELDIHAISISQITDDFLSYIQEMSALNIELASEFIFVAATLMRIKSRLLLPRPEQGEDGKEIDPKQDLVQKLIEYKKFKDLSLQMRDLEDERHCMERRGNILADGERAAEQAEAGEELASFDLYKLLLAYDKCMYRYRTRSEEVTHTVVQYPYTIEQQKKAIAELIQLNKKMDFSELMKKSENRVHLIYNFLAILEMLQQQLLSIESGLGFNNFWVTEKEVPANVTI